MPERCGVPPSVVTSHVEPCEMRAARPARRNASAAFAGSKVRALCACVRAEQVVRVQVCASRALSVRGIGGGVCGGEALKACEETVQKFSA